MEARYQRLSNISILQPVELVVADDCDWFLVQCPVRSDLDRAVVVGVADDRRIKLIESANYSDCIGCCG